MAQHTEAAVHAHVLEDTWEVSRCGFYVDDELQARSLNMHATKKLSIPGTSLHLLGMEPTSSTIDGFSCGPQQRW